ncbi:MAG: hypothetical protein A4E35_00579 [Methanoregula sp. PtaU1.Bin051]|nr:MAG: hypothetical protein A4E35_00579 [Methanoregula sp. PtaU1.Bin051]
MIVPFGDEILIIKNEPSFLMVGRVVHRFSLCIETPSDEYCQTVDAGDLIVVSAPEGGEPDAAFMLIELVRRHHAPLIVLNKDHPGSQRLRYVVSVGSLIETNCSIRRGTHPEQHLICSSEKLSGITLAGVPRGCDIRNIPYGASVELFKAEVNILPSGRPVALPESHGRKQE